MTSKVRIACRRCRAKRIKCDGNTPACGNCQKAGEPCVDVDGRNNAISIPRDFASSARARIEWLEENLRLVSPGFDLNAGPRVDFSFTDASAGLGAASSPAVSQEQASQLPPTLAEDSQVSAANKRAFSSIAETQPHDSPFTEDARSVALDLGMLTLNSDSRQMHYLGTSSGRLFASLIGVSGASEVSVGTRSSRSASNPSLPSPAGRLGPFAHAKRLKESYRVVYETLKKALPPPEDVHILLEVYFLNIHVDHPFIHPASLINAIDALYHCAAAESSIEMGHNGWVTSVKPFTYNGEFEHSRNLQTTPISVFTATFHVFMVFALAATVRTRQRMYDFAPDQFHRVAMSVAPSCFANTSLASLQGVLLMAVHSLISPTELNIWTLTYVAMAHSIDLGLHRPIGAEGDSLATVSFMRQMVFYNVYHLDRSIAAVQGRPLGIRDEAFDVQLPTLEEIQSDAALIPDRTYTPEVPIASIVAFALHRFKLDPIVSEIKLLFYHLPAQVSAYTWPSDHHAAQHNIRKRLDDWRKDLAQLASSLPMDDEYGPLEWRKYETKLHSQYFAAMILLYQPSQMIPHPSEQALLLCYQSARGRLNAYNDLYHMDSFYQSWRSVQGIFSSGATMIYCLWTSGLVRDVVAPSDAMSDFRTCSNLLSVGGEWWPSVKKGKETFSKATDALLKKLEIAHGQSQVGSGQSREARSRARFAPLEASAAKLNNAPPADVSFLGPTVDNVESSKRARSSLLAVNQLIPSVHPSEGDPSFMQNFNGQSISDPAADFSTTDWSGLESGDHVLREHGFTDADFENSCSMNDPTVEAFIAEFLNNDTAWNPF